MNAEAIKARLELLRQGEVGLAGEITRLESIVEQHRANLHATRGAIQENERWLQMATGGKEPILELAGLEPAPQE